MNFRSYEIKDICKIKSGKRLPKGTDFSEKPTKHKYIRARDIKNGKIDGSDLGYISEETQKKIERYIVNTNDIIITIAGTIGEVALVSKKFDGVNLTENAVRLTEFSKDVCPEFLAYILKSPERKEYMEQVAGGSAQPKLGIYKIEAIKVDLPDIQIQHKIADILSAYDDLIENNQKQIKLLEEAVQRLYKEWFVDLHFPGHENTKIVDGVPEGWQWCKVRDVADINSSALPKNYKEDFIDYVDLGSVRCGHIETRTRYNLNEAPGRAKRCAKDGDIIWGMVRPNLKAYALVTNPKETDVFSTGFAVLSAKKVPYSYLYCAVTQEEFVGYLVNATNGAAYPAVKPVHFEVADILKPDDKVLEQFHSVADSIYRKKEALENQNHNLRESRDLILPKLMSGEVEV